MIKRIIDFFRYLDIIYRKKRNRKRAIKNEFSIRRNECSDEIGARKNEAQYSLEGILGNIDSDRSLTSLESTIDYLANQKKELDKRKRNKLNNQLDQIIFRANARLNKLRVLSYDELELERILIQQKLLSKRTLERTGYGLVIPDFSNLLKLENELIETDLTKENYKVEKESKEFEEELVDILRGIQIALPSEDEIVVQDADSRIYEVIEDECHTEEIIDCLRANGVKYFHHVTNYENAPSIEEKGLYSWEKLNKLGVDYKNELTIGLSKSLDIRRDKQNYVRLSFCKATPMFYAKKELQTNVIYKISIDCLRECEFEFSNMNGTDNDVCFGSTMEFLKNNIRLRLFDRIYFDLTDVDKKYYQAEILIKEHIPTKYIIDKIPF